MSGEKRWIQGPGLASKEEPANERPEELSRRTMVKLMAASALLATGMTGCKRKPERPIVSLAETPEYQKPGRALYYASTWTEGKVPYGIMIKTVDGRPIKIEGLPNHPINRGASNAQMQASILSLYDPDRLRAPTIEGKETTWEEADKQILAAIKRAKKLALVTRSSIGPSMRAMVERFLKACPKATHYVHEPMHDGPRRGAWNKVYKAEGEPVPDFKRCNIILSVDCDFLGTDGPVLESIREFAATRDVQRGKLSRLYAAESGMTVTGSNADHRLPIRPSTALQLVQALRDAVRGNDTELSKMAGHGEFLKPLAGDLKQNRGACVVLAGTHLPEPVHAAVALLNDELKAALEWNPLPATLPAGKLPEIAGDTEVIQLGAIRIPHSILPTVTHGAYQEHGGISLPTSHNLESWNDATAGWGIRSICQPVIAPIFNTRQEEESLLTWTKALDPSLEKYKDWYSWVRAQWEENGLPDWNTSLRAGFAGSRKPAAVPAVDNAAAEALAKAAPSPHGKYELVIQPHHSLLDGRFDRNAWLQELPDPVTKLVWDHAATVGPETAERLHVEEGGLIETEFGGWSCQAPALIQPGVAPGVIVTTRMDPAFEQGKQFVTPWYCPNLSAGTVSGAKHKLVRTQKHFDMGKRPIVIDGTLDEYKENPKFVLRKRHIPQKVQLHASHDYSKGNKWGMAVDLNACVGCGICMAACQAENNIPVVGKEECALGREMHWIRLDRYHKGDPANPTVFQQPMTCQHCDNAPCEPVCPVNATAHSTEGLNEQIYNRCVGTRYCANNCPYKVRRYNFYDYQDRVLKDPVQELSFNPQVTVRMRGVMEKCTFCVQRINEAKFQAKNRGEEVPDGTVAPACAQACPAGAIVFGNINDKSSRIAALRDSPLSYFVLEELNVRPNVAYLARVRNPHPDTVKKG